MPTQDGAAGAEGSAARKAVSEVLGDRYEIDRKLGAGAFGEVYEAVDRSLGRKVAIKRIRLDAFAEGPELEEVKKRFVQEAQVAAALRHPSIVTIHDIAASGTSSFMVMELVHGQTLQAHLREKGRLGLEESLRILSQAAAALDFAHASGVIHRDVKPANLMIEPSGQVKVMDFGIAKGQSSGNITRTGAILGTPNYMAPEQAQGGRVDGRADLFSLGCVLYECLSGRKPFVGDTVTAILIKILNEAPPAVDFDALKLPAPLGDVLRRALAKDPQERYPTGQALVEAAQAAATGRPAATARPEQAGVATLDSGTPPTVVPAATAHPGAGGVASSAVTPSAIAPSAVSPSPVASSAAAAAPAPLAPSATRGSGLRRAGLLGAGAFALLAVLVTAWAALRPAAGAAPEGVRVSRFVTREEPGFFGKLMGAKARLHLTVPEGASLRVRLETALSSETAQPGEEFTATTSAPLEVDGFAAFPAGSRVKGHISHSAGSGKVSGRGELTLEFDRIVTSGGGEMLIEAEPLQRKARSTVKRDAAKVGAAAGVGAIVGGILGGGKGAAIGGAVGGSAGTGVVLATKGEEVVLPTGTSLDLRLRSPLTVMVEAPSR